MDAAVLNAGLKLAMAFGEYWLQPIQSRLAGTFPELSRAELDEYDSLCREAMNFGHAQVPSSWRSAGGSQREAFRLFREIVLRRYGWVSDDNLSHLFAQGCYYAWKDGDLP
jgi:hypothetical protein